MARCAGGNAPNITAFRVRGSVFLVSGQCGVPQWPCTTKLPRSFGQQRGHVPPPVAALGGNGTSPLYPVRCFVVSASGHGGVPPCPSITRLSRGVRGLCSVRPLRPPASLLHNAAFCKMSASQSQAPFVAATASGPFGFTKKALCKIAYAGAGASTACTPQPLRVLRAVASRSFGVLTPWHKSGATAHGFG